MKEDILKGQLECGVFFDGKHHVDFEIRLPLMKDNIRVASLYPGESALALSVAVMAQAIVSLGDIPKEKITFELLAEELVEDDFDILNEAFNTLKKKRVSRVKSLSITTPQESS